MAKQPAKNVNIAVNAVALESHVDSFTLSVEQETPEVTSFNDSGPRRVTGNYDYNLELGGSADFAAGQSDATLYGMLGSAGVAMAVDPTGATAGPNDPNYDAASVVLESYEISGSTGQAVKYKASVQGNSALARNVA